MSQDEEGKIGMKNIDNLEEDNPKRRPRRKITEGRPGKTRSGRIYMQRGMYSKGQKLNKEDRQEDKSSNDEHESSGTIASQSEAGLSSLERLFKSEGASSFSQDEWRLSQDETSPSDWLINENGEPDSDGRMLLKLLPESNEQIFSDAESITSCLNEDEFIERAFLLAEISEDEEECPKEDSQEDVIDIKN